MMMMRSTARIDRTRAGERRTRDRFSRTNNGGRCARCSLGRAFFFFFFTREAEWDGNEGPRAASGFISSRALAAGPFLPSRIVLRDARTPASLSPSIYRPFFGFLLPSPLFSLRHFPRLRDTSEWPRASRAQSVSLLPLPGFTEPNRVSRRVAFFHPAHLGSVQGGSRCVCVRETEIDR